MKLATIILLIGLILISCDRELHNVEFAIKINGFEMEYEGSGTFDQFHFSHTFSGATLRFVSGDEVFEYHLRTKSIESHTYSLPEGTYTLELLMMPASLYGQAEGTFDIKPGDITVTTEKDTIIIDVIPDCALFLVSDKRHQLQEVPYMIERYISGNGYYRSYPLTLDTISGLYYCYFTPDPDPANPSAYLWFYDDITGAEQGGYSTVGCEPGFAYFFEVLD